MDITLLAQKQSHLQSVMVPDSTKKTEVDSATPFFQGLASSLFVIWRDVHKRAEVSVDSMEIEARIGMILSHAGHRWMPQISKRVIIIPTETQKKGHSLTFEAGIDDVHLNFLRRVLQPHSFSSETKPPERVRIDQEGNRWIIGENGSVLHVERKSKLIVIDVALLSFEYDVRLALASEVRGNEQVMNSSHYVERLKRRTTFRVKNKSSPLAAAWRIDVTEVENQHQHMSGGNNRGKAGVGDAADASQYRSVELEFEMENDVKALWLREKDESKAIEITSAIATQLQELLELCIASSSDVVSETSLSLCDDIEAADVNASIDRLKEAMNMDVAISGEKRLNDFIGAMPLNLSRRNLMIIQRNDYFVTEKSDGVRHLLFVVSGPVAIFMDRSKNRSSLFKAPGSAGIGQALGKGTVLDGELVYNRSLKRTLFLVFDVLSVDEGPCLQRKFSERLQILNSVIMPRCAQYLNGITTTTNTTNTNSSLENLILVRKNFYERARFSELLSKVRIEGRDRVYFDSERRHHKTDGFIFQPDAPYTFYADVALLKWKYADMRSVDLKVIHHKTEDVVMLFCMGPDGTEIDCTRRGSAHVGLGKFDAYRLLGDMRDTSVMSPYIAEVTYNAVVGLWSYSHLRKDKGEPNNIITVMGVLMEQAEGISLEELEYKMLCCSAAYAAPVGRSIISGSNGGNSTGLQGFIEDDYAIRLTKMTDQLMSWKRADVASGGMRGGVQQHTQLGAPKHPHHDSSSSSTSSKRAREGD